MAAQLNRLSVFLLVCLLVAMVAASAGAQTISAEANSKQISDERPNADASKPAGKRVFYASHSLMWYVPEPLNELVRSQGIAGHEMSGLQKIGASRTLQHWNLPETQNTAKKALVKGEVDFLVMSPIQLPDEGIENFVKLGLQHNPNMQFFVQFSWGGGDIDNQDFPEGAWNKPAWNKTPDQLAKMNVANIKAGEAQIDALNDSYGNGNQIVFAIPTAQAAVELRSRIFRNEVAGLNEQGELFVDPAHPSPPLEALNIYLHYAVLYRQSPIGLPMLDILKRANQPKWDETLNRTLQEIAWKVATEYPRAGIGSAKITDDVLPFDAPAADEIPSLEFVYTAYVDVGNTLEAGQGTDGRRRVIPITGGTFEGPRIRGKIITGGFDWNLSRSDGATVAEATYFLQTDDGVVIRITNTGVGAPPAGLRFTTPTFEAPQGKYEWLNQSVFVGTLDVEWNREHPIRIRVFRLK